MFNKNVVAHVIFECVTWNECYCYLWAVIEVLTVELQNLKQAVEHACLLMWIVDQPRANGYSIIAKQAVGTQHPSSRQV